jgi:hypothetical protein
MWRTYDPALITFAVLASHAAETLTLKPVLADDRALTTLSMFKVTGSEPADPAANGRP